MQGWIKLHRSLLGSAIASHPEYLAVWIHLMMRATHKQRECVVGRTIVALNPGDLVFGRKKFSAETGVSENKVRAALGVLQSLGQITSKSHAKFSVISITKWSEYQLESPANNHEITSKSPALNQQMTTNKNVKNVKNEENGREVTTTSESKIPTCPVERIIDAYKASAPSLVQPRITPDAVKAQIAARWRESPEHQSLEFWREFFKYCEQSDFLAGRSDGRGAKPFRVGLEWVVKSSNFAKIINGNYHGESATA